MSLALARPRRRALAASEIGARTRLLAAFALIAAISTLEEPAALLAALALAAALFAARAAADPASWPRLRRRIAHLEGFLALALLVLPFTTPGAPLFAVGPLSASAEGLALSLAIVAKVNAAALIALALIASTPPTALGRALAGLGAPPRLVQLFLFTARYLSVIEADARALFAAMRARGFALRSHPRSWRGFGMLVGLTLLRALDRAERVGEAMRCRGVSGRFPRAAAEPFRWADGAALGGALALAAALLALEAGA